MLEPFVSKEEHAKLPADLQKEYVDRDGKLVLDVREREGYALKDVGNLMRALSTERTKTKDLEAKMEAVADLDPKAAREALEKVQKMSTWTPQDKLDEKIAAREKQLVDKHTGELKTRDERITKMDAQVRRLLITSEAQRVIGDQGSHELLLPIFDRNTRVEVDSQGNYVARVVDNQGNPRITTRSGSTDPMTIEEFAGVLKQDPKYAGAWNGSGASGSGSSGAPKTGGSPGLGSKTLRSDDVAGIGANLEGIAAGKVSIGAE